MSYFGSDNRSKALRERLLQKENSLSVIIEPQSGDEHVTAEEEKDDMSVSNFDTEVIKEEVPEAEIQSAIEAC